MIRVMHCSLGFHDSRRLGCRQWEGIGWLLQCDFRFNLFLVSLLVLVIGLFFIFSLVLVFLSPFFVKFTKCFSIPLCVAM